MNPVQFTQTLVTIYCNPRGNFPSFYYFCYLDLSELTMGCWNRGPTKNASGLVSLQAVAITPVAQWMEWHLIRPHDFIDLISIKIPYIVTPYN